MVSPSIYWTIDGPETVRYIPDMQEAAAGSAGKRAGWRLSPTGAIGQPAFVLYGADPPGEAYNAFGLMVLSIEESPAAVSALTIFQDTAIVKRFGFPLVERFPH